MNQYDKKFITKVIRVLVDRSLIDKQNDDGETLLVIAVCKNKETIVKMLLELGADVDIRDKSWNSALIWASRKGYEKIANFYC